MLCLLVVVFALHPFADVKVTWSVQWNRILIKQIRHEDEVAVSCQNLFVGGNIDLPICSELVCDELSIVETVADDIGDAAVLSEV